MAAGDGAGVGADHPDRTPLVVAAYIVVAVVVLVALRANVDSLDFIGIGWILALAALPLLPWALPRLGDFLRSVAPYVKTFSVGGLQLELNDVGGDAIVVPTDGALAALPEDASALSSGTDIGLLVSALQSLRDQGGSPVAIIDLRAGQKWRLPNLYFLARLLEVDPVVSQLVFTEERHGVDGYLVGTAECGPLRRAIERDVPPYAAASASLAMPTVGNLSDVAQAHQMGTSFVSLRAALGPMMPGVAAWDWVTTDFLRSRPGLLAADAVDATGPSLAEGDLAVVVRSPLRFVPTVAAGRLTGVVDRDAVALVVARSAVASAGRR
jgi:hypothetical protein